MLSDLIQYFTNNQNNQNNINSANINLYNQLDPVYKMLEYVHKNTLNDEIKSQIEYGIDNSEESLMSVSSYGIDSFYSLNTHYEDIFQPIDDDLYQPQNIIFNFLFSTIDKGIDIFYNEYSIESFLEKEDEDGFGLKKFIEVDESNNPELLNREVKRILTSIASNNYIDYYLNDVASIKFALIEFSPNVKNIIDKLIHTDYYVKRMFYELGIIHQGDDYWLVCLEDMEEEVHISYQVDINIVLKGLTTIREKLQAANKENNINTNIETTFQQEKEHLEFYNKLERINNEAVEDYGSAYDYYSADVTQSILNSLEKLHAPLKEDIIL